MTIKKGSIVTVRKELEGRDARTWREFCHYNKLNASGNFEVSKVTLREDAEVVQFTTNDKFSFPLYWFVEVPVSLSKADELTDTWEQLNEQEIAKVTGTGMKFDGDKVRMDLLLDGCPNALEAVGKVLTFGAKKYADHSWQGVPNGDTRYKAALLRHMLAISKGENDDPESGLSHLAHVACNALFILELELKRNERI